MKFCKHCGAEISEGSTVCTKCNASLKETPSNEGAGQNISKKFNKMLIVMPLVVVLTAAVTFVLTYFLLPQRIADAIGELAATAVSAEKEQLVEQEIHTVASSYDSNSKCPVYENKYHDWKPANCTEPAKCIWCNAYRDNVLADRHDWLQATCTEPAKCRDCGEYKDDKLAENSHEWSTPNCVDPAKCENCGKYRDDKLGSHYYRGSGICEYCGMRE